MFVQQMDRSCSEHANVLASFLSTILRFVKGKVGGASKDESRGKTKADFRMACNKPMYLNTLVGTAEKG